MKPLVLELKAFGPFAGSQRIDFGELGEKSFFLIHGPTGSGKTSILDGIAFALYGDSSGGERDGRQMRSHHADAATLTEVSLDFALGDARYRVRRVPEQMRPARRGGGETKQNPLAELWRLDSPAQAPAEAQVQRESATADGASAKSAAPASSLAGAKPLAAGWSDVTRQIVALLGFESRQFRQVIMLPQGRFREFLTVGTPERERILQTLFGTEIYRRAEDALKDAARALEREAETVRARRQALLDQAEVADEAALTARVDAQQAASAAAQSAEQSATQAAQAAEKALADARLVAERFAEVDAARVGQSELLAAQPAWALRRGELAAAQTAATLQPLADAASDARRQHAAEAQRQQALTAALNDASRQQAATATALAGEEAKAPQRAQANARLGELDALAERVGALATLRGELATASSASEQAQTTLAARRLAVRQAVETQAAAQTALQQAQLAAATLAGVQAEDLRLQALLAQREGYARLGEAQARAQQELSQKTQALAQAEAARDAARAQRAAVAADWLAGQAARLAQSLHAGEPCPVCGAREHPAPAGAAGHGQSGDLFAEPAAPTALVGDSELQAADAALAAGERRYADAQRDQLAAQQSVALNAARLADLARALGAAVEAPAASLRAEAAAVRARLAALTATAATLPALGAALSEAERQRLSAESAQTAAESAAQAAQSRQAQLAGQFAERAAGIPEALLAPGALAAAQTQARQQLAALEQALVAATQAARAAGEALASAQARQGESAQALTRLAQAAGEREQAFAARVLAAGFADSAAWAAARRDAATTAALENALRSNDAALAAAGERLLRANAAVEGRTRPALPAVQEAHDAARAQQLAAARAARDAQALLASSRQFAATLASLAGEHAALEARYGVLRQVADTASGNNPQRLSFQRYVLATLLEQVLVATTQRLARMSRGRYEMRRREAPVDQRSAAGLDLEVFDQHTGSTRAVATLSGGESFLASLALALGLSDVVQAAAGGIRLDAIFVDEGFGTLDPEALDAAIRALKDLQQAGRMVGIISHVAELKEWIDARLELLPGPRGSVARFS